MTPGQRFVQWPRWSWHYVLFLAGVLAFVLGLYGFLQMPTCDPTEPFPPAPAMVLKTLQLFFYAVPPGDICTTSGWVAAFLAPFAFAGALLAALGVRTRRAVQRLGLLAQPAHDVFLGAGETASGLAMRRRQALAYRKRGTKLIGLDLKAATPLGRALEGLGIAGFSRVGNALSVEALAPLQLHRARNIWITTGDDYRNLEVARRVCGLLQGYVAGDGEAPVRLLASVFDRHLVRAKDALFSDGNDRRPVLEFFNMPRLAARMLLREHPPLPARGRGAAHALIVGGGDLAAALVVHLAQHCVHHEHRDDCVRITLAGEGAPALRQRLLEQFPALAAHSDDPALGPLLPLARIATLQCDAVNLSFLQWQALQNEMPFDAVYVAAGSDLLTMGAAIRAAALRDLAVGTTASAQPIVACLQQTSGSLCALSRQQVERHFLGGSEAAGEQEPPLVHLFDVYERCIRADEAYPGEQQDGRAMLVRAVYHAGDAPFIATQAAVRQALRDWRTDPDEDFRWSNRLAADHIDVKLDRLADLARRHGVDPAMLPTLRRWRELEKESPDTLADAVEAALQIGDLAMAIARIEHRRFIAERLLEGWLPLPPQRLRRGPDGKPDEMQKRRLRLNHTLVCFDQLAEVDSQADQRRKDLAMVQAIPQILRGQREAENLPAPD